MNSPEELIKVRPVPSAALRYRQAVRSRDIDEFGSAARELRSWMIANDPHYPIFHFVPPEGWMNDPNGPIYHDGRYHLFCKYDPVVAVAEEAVPPDRWRRSARCWGHAVSSDLVHWEDWPVAMWPDTAEDVKGVWSGNTFVAEDGTPCALYTGYAGRSNESRYGILARSHDGMLTWEKQVVMRPDERPHPDTKVHHDGYIWRRANTWYQLVGGTTGGADPQGAAYLWTSEDLETWRFRRNIAPGIRFGKFWELPYLIRFDGRPVLFVGGGVVFKNPFWLGAFDYDTLVFTPDDPVPQQVDTGSFYSFNLNMTDDRGEGGSRRQLMHGWITGPPSPTERAPYWQGTHSVPRIISCRDGDLWQEQIPEIDVLRRRHHRFGGADIERITGAAERAAARLIGVKGDAIDVVARFGAGGAGTFGLKLRVSEDRTDHVRVYFDRATGAFGVDGPTVDQTAELTDEESFKNRAASNDSQLSSDEPVTMRILLDRSVIEVFVNGRAISTQMFPAADAQGIELFAANGILETPVESIDIYEMSSMWSGGGAPAPQ